MHSLPVFLRLQGQPVLLVGGGEAAAAKRRLLERAGAHVSDEALGARIAVVALDDDREAEATVARLRAQGLLVNAVDRPHLCDFTLPAIVDRDPVLIAIGTGGASAGLAAALRQRFETLLPARLGALADALHAGRAALRARWPDAGARRRGIGALLAAGAPLDPLGGTTDIDPALARVDEPTARLERIAILSHDPDELTLRAARLLGEADRIFHAACVPSAILDRARADALRIEGAPPALAQPGLSIVVEWHGA